MRVAHGGVGGVKESLLAEARPWTSWDFAGGMPDSCRRPRGCEMARDLIPSYRHSLAGVREAMRRAHNRAATEDEPAKADLSLLHGMEQDLIWTLTYLEWGHPPPDDACRTVPMDPQRMQARVAAEIHRRRSHRTPERRAQREAVLAALRGLSPREREAVLMVKAEGMSYGDAARALGVSKASVQSYVTRGLEKLIAACHTVSA